MKFNQFKYTTEEGAKVVLTVEVDSVHVLTPDLKDVEVHTAEDVRAELKKLLAGEESRLERLTEENSRVTK